MFFLFSKFLLGVFFNLFCGVLDHVLQPPCWRYGGGSFTKKIGNFKNQFTCFSVFPYSKPFGAHATSNACIYFQQKLFYRHRVGDTEVALL